MDARSEALQQRLGHRFEREELLARALTHRSFGAEHNERLEFLGDAVLNLAVRDNSGVLVSDPNVKLFATADGDIKDGVVRLDSGRANVTAGTDTLGVVLLEPVADVAKFDSGKASVALTGDLNRWRGRVGKLVGWPSDSAIIFRKDSAKRRLPAITAASPKSIASMPSLVSSPAN